MFLSEAFLPYRPQRIISLVPSLTELLHSLELNGETIAVTKFCVHPQEWHKNKIHIGGTKTLNIQKIVSLKPDLIIANKEENIKEQIELLATKFPVWVTDVNTWDDAIHMIEDISQLTHTVERGHSLLEKIKEAFKNQIHPTVVKTAAYLIWKEPLMVAGGNTFITDMMKHAGMTNVFESISRYPIVTIDEIRSSACEMLLLSTEPYPFSHKHIKHFQDILPGRQIRLVDGEIFSWYGSRLLLAPEYFTRLNSEQKETD